MFSVIFEVHPGEGRKDVYLEHGKVLKPELENIDGFIDNERFASRTRPGWVLSHSTWRDEKSVIRWRTHAGHHLVQEKSRLEVFSDYHLRVGEVTADSHPPEGHTIREQRFDETEVGGAKVCQLCEMVPRAGHALPEDLVGALGPTPAAGGLLASDVFASIYNPGKVMLLLSWVDTDAASACKPTAPAQAERMRIRNVRVIRDYGMFDRRESPQFYPPVDPREKR
ncbi:antibiotic biosynthesis monooxygenase [Methylobacterium sp. NEAU K]|uniref:antibiotic biosynthesis monooxygenase family protein n=1 Tax=Methylobacterium sp. NEAU K TaxID=3064946 RepID=UPI0027347145|nr:antibiotic biosynthesis monooxygenase [Methylobacterium sp. NEAU K]MDP4006540.1 antibiotic biosynthesis monooxygenase [Methylobacterium sp. NEAU K]